MAWYLNYYRDADCGASWTDEWSCQCNDRCPRCRHEIEPYDSEDLSILVEKGLPGDSWVVYVSPDEAEDRPRYIETYFRTEKEAREFADGVRDATAQS